MTADYDPIDDEAQALIQRLTLIAVREERGDWLPRVRKGPPTNPTKDRRSVGEEIHLVPSDHPDWRREAFCLRVEGDWFDIPSGGRARQEDVKKTELATCQACDVMEECKEAGAQGA